MPGGHCELGEHPANTARREFLEETGLPARIDAYFGSWIDSADRPDDTPSIVLYFVGALEVPHRSNRTSEATGSAWFPLDELPLDLAFPHHLRSVLTALRDSTPDPGGVPTIRPSSPWQMGHGRTSPVLARVDSTRVVEGHQATLMGSPE